MHNSFIEQLTCPYCGSDFGVSYKVEQNEKELINGVLSCDCSEFPVLNGILVLNLSSLNDFVLENVKNNNIRKAIMICLGVDYFRRIQIEQTTSLILPFPHQLSDIMRYFLSSSAEITVEKKFGRVYDHYSDKSLPFFNILGNNTFDKYLKHRFSTDSFFSLYPFLNIIDEKKARILDLGCGAGHGSFVLSQYVKPLDLCCADKCYNLLYLAKKYFAPKANFICLDFENALPFKNGIFSSIIMSDALFIVRSRFSFIHEISRVLMQNGLSLFLHVHSSLGNDLAPIGNRRETMTPKAWKHLFERINLPTVMISEEKVLKDFLYQNRLNLLSRSSEDELNCSDALIIFSTSDKNVFRDYDNVDNFLLNEKKNLVINPIYDITIKGSEFILSRPSMSANAVGDFYPVAESYIPNKIEIKKNLVKNTSVSKESSEQLDDLIRKFVVLNVPEKFM